MMSAAAVPIPVLCIFVGLVRETTVHSLLTFYFAFNWLMFLFCFLTIWILLQVPKSKKNTKRENKLDLIFWLMF